MRTRHKMWRNAPGGKWTRRIIWFQGPDDNDIRLQCEDSEQVKNLFPENRQHADLIWEDFKNGVAVNDLMS